MKNNQNNNSNASTKIHYGRITMLPNGKMQNDLIVGKSKKTSKDSQTHSNSFKDINIADSNNIKDSLVFIHNNMIFSLKFRYIGTYIFNAFKSKNKAFYIESSFHIRF